MKHFRLLTIFLVTLLLTGCLAPSLRFTISPNPINITKGTTAIPELTLKVKTKGFGSNFKIDQATVEIKDHEGQRVGEIQKHEINESVKVIVPFVSTSVTLEDIELAGIEKLNEATYDEHLKGKEYTLTITLIGTKNSAASAKIKFE